MKKVKAFTLIELLVVVVIIGILAALVVLSLNSSVKKSKEARGKDSIKKTQTAFSLVLQEASSFDKSNGMKALCNGAERTINAGILTSIATADGTKLLSSVPPDANGNGINFKCNAGSDYVIYAESIYDSTKCFYASSSSSNISDQTTGAPTQVCGANGANMTPGM